MRSPVAIGCGLLRRLVPDRRAFAVLSLALATACSDDAVSVPDDMSSGGVDLRRRIDLSPASDLARVCGDVPILGPQFDKVSEACAACTLSRCCQTLSACAADPDCVATRVCYLTCNGPDDTACNMQCRVANGNSVASDAVTLCRNAGCSNECANYSCIGHVVWPPPANPTVSFTIAVTDYVNGAPVADAAVRICPVADGACAMPLGSGITDVEGQLPVTLPTVPGAPGAYLEIVAQGYPVTLAYLARPVDKSLGGTSPTVALIDRKTAAQLATSVKVAQDPMKAMVAFIAFQCTTYHAPGIIVDAGSGTEFYVVGNQLNISAFTTDKSGSGVIFNVTPGATTIRSTFDNKRYGAQPVTTRAGAVTTMAVVPTP